MSIRPHPARPWRRLLALTGALLVGMSLAPVAANHMQMDSGRIIVFDHLGGNEWWVEAALAGQDGGQVAALHVAVYDSPRPVWKPMTWNAEWGKWAAGVHVPPGLPVKFRALWDGGAMQDSCWFSHPDGHESCGGPGPSPTPFDATFTMVKGNEWWVQAQVSPNEGHALDHVEVSADAGPWRSLQLQSWGVREYAASYHLPPGTIVQLRAVDKGGLADLSDCHRWVPPANADAIPVACGSATFTASWTQVRGNEWWAEAVVGANAPLNAMFLTMDCQGEPADMVYRADWDKWVLGGVRIPHGTKVTFTAIGETGSAESAGYLWPQATPTAGC